MKVVIVLDVNESWSTENIKGNLEEEFPGWKVAWLTFITNAIADELAKTVSINRESREAE